MILQDLSESMFNTMGNPHDEPNANLKPSTERKLKHVEAGVYRTNNDSEMLQYCVDLEHILEGSKSGVVELLSKEKKLVETKDPYFVIMMEWVLYEYPYIGLSGDKK